MTHKTVTVDVDVDFDLDEFEDSELIDEMNQRGYTCTKEEAVELEREDWQYLIEMLDKNAETWYTRRVRDKLMAARYG